MPKRVLIMLPLLATAVLCASSASADAPAAPPDIKQTVGAGQDEVKVSPEGQRAIEGALRFLASKQLPSGAWTDKQDHQAAITAYVMMTFMSTGNLPNEGEYGKVMARGLTFLLDCVRPDGYVAARTGQSNMYGHGIATIALGEIYGQTRDASIRPKLNEAIKLIIKCQNKEGGWRYNPRVGDADISVTVLQAVALRVAQNSGIEVPEHTITRAIDYVKSCRHSSGGFTYQPRSAGAGFARTAAAVYSLQVLGQYDDPVVASGAKYLQANRERDKQWFTYGHFYAAPAFYMIGGDAWKSWYADMSKMILTSSTRKSQGELTWWEPIEGSRGVGPVYATAVYTSILAMPYHYLPIYQR